MHIEALDLLRSPCCQAPLLCRPAEQNGVDIESGQLTCTACGATYAIEQGMPLLHLADESWLPKAREAEGWVIYHKNMGIYDPVEDAIDLKIPYYPEEPWIGVAKSFDLALDWLNLTGEETVLDLGAGRGWASKAFALRGCRAMAVDVVTDDAVGLGRGRVLMEKAGTYFERVIADGENLPLAPNSFDIVFASAALHHFSDLDAAFAQIAKLLKPGGILCAIREPCVAIVDNAAWVLARDGKEEMAVGINETRPGLAEYIHSLSAAGLEIVRAATPEMARLDEAALEGHLRYVGALPPAGHDVWHLSRAKNYGRYLALRARTMVNHRSLAPGRLVDGYPHRQYLEMSGLLWIGGELVLLARKPLADAI